MLDSNNADAPHYVVSCTTSNAIHCKRLRESRRLSQSNRATLGHIAIWALRSASRNGSRRRRGTATARYWSAGV